MILHDCPACDKGKVTVQVSTYGQPASSVVSESKCIWCDGTGKMYDQRLKQYNTYQTMWCTCDNVGADVVYYENGVHPEIKKHHYRHTKCGKVVQVG